jgi:hypothetical protein
MKLSFGNMSLDINIFSIPKQPTWEDDDILESDMIDALVQEEFNQSYSDDPLESCLVNSVYESEEYSYNEQEVAQVCSILESEEEEIEQAMWTTHFEDYLQGTQCLFLLALNSLNLN